MATETAETLELEGSVGGSGAGCRVVSRLGSECAPAAAALQSAALDEQLEHMKALKRLVKQYELRLREAENHLQPDLLLEKKLLRQEDAESPESAATPCEDDDRSEAGLKEAMARCQSLVQEVEATVEAFCQQVETHRESLREALHVALRDIKIRTKELLIAVGRIAELDHAIAQVQGRREEALLKRSQAALSEDAAFKALLEERRQLCEEEKKWQKELQAFDSDKLVALTAQLRRLTEEKAKLKEALKMRIGKEGLALLNLPYLDQDVWDFLEYTLKFPLVDEGELPSNAKCSEETSQKDLQHQASTPISAQESESTRKSVGGAAWYTARLRRFSRHRASLAVPFDNARPLSGARETSQESPVDGEVGRGDCVHPDSISTTTDPSCSDGSAFLGHHACGASLQRAEQELVKRFKEVFHPDATEALLDLFALREREARVSQKLINYLRKAEGHNVCVITETPNSGKSNTYVCDDQTSTPFSWLSELTPSVGSKTVEPSTSAAVSRTNSLLLAPFLSTVQAEKSRVDQWRYRSGVLAMVGGYQIVATVKGWQQNQFAGPIVTGSRAWRLAGNEEFKMLEQIEPHFGKVLRSVMREMKKPSHDRACGVGDGASARDVEQKSAKKNEASPFGTLTDGVVVEVIDDAGGTDQGRLVGCGTHEEHGKIQNVGTSVDVCAGHQAQGKPRFRRKRKTTSSIYRPYGRMLSWPRWLMGACDAIARVVITFGVVAPPPHQEF